MNHKYKFNTGNSWIVIDLDKVNYKTYNDVDLSKVKPMNVDTTDFIAYDECKLIDIIEKLTSYTINHPDAYINLSSEDSYECGELNVTYQVEETADAYKRRIVDTQKHIFATWKGYNGKKEASEKTKQKTIDNLRKQAAKLGFDLTEKE